MVVALNRAVNYEHNPDKTLNTGFYEHDHNPKPASVRNEGAHNCTGHRHLCFPMRPRFGIGTPPPPPKKKLYPISHTALKYKSCPILVRSF